MWDFYQSWCRVRHQLSHGQGEGFQHGGEHHTQRRAPRTGGLPASEAAAAWTLVRHGHAPADRPRAHREGGDASPSETLRRKEVGAMICLRRSFLRCLPWKSHLHFTHTYVRPFSTNLWCIFINSENWQRFWDIVRTCGIIKLCMIVKGTYINVEKRKFWWTPKDDVGESGVKRTTGAKRTTPLFLHMRSASKFSK